jgi:hypothetical protein
MTAGATIGDRADTADGWTLDHIRRRFTPLHNEVRSRKLGITGFTMLPRADNVLHDKCPSSRVAQGMQMRRQFLTHLVVL